MVTGLYAGLLALIYIGLSALVISKRLKHKINLGDGPNDVILKAVRAHGNFAEFVPIALILMLICEINIADPFAPVPFFMHVFGIALVLGRVMHAIGLMDIIPIARPAGMILTFLTILGLGGLLIFQFVTA
jgi:uncharacterized membrane protein YecN with MAPEG domain